MQGAGLCYLAPMRSAHSRGPRQGLSFFKLVLALALALLLVEGVLRMGLIPGYAEAEMRPSIEKLQEDAMSTGHPYLAYAPKPGHVDTHGTDYKRTSYNAAGFRGPDVAIPKPGDVYRVICLGGSSTHGQTPNTDEDTWPARLQVHLNATLAERGVTNRRAEVLNFGVFGYNTFESLINLSFRGVDYEPDLVLVYHTINDARCAMYQLGGPVQRDNSHWRAIWPTIMPSPGESALEKSLVYCALRKKFTGYLKRFETLDAFAIVNYDYAHPDPYAGEVPDTGFDSFGRNLRSIVAVAKAHGADVMLISQGCDREDIRVTGSYQEQWNALDRMGRIIQETAHSAGAGFCDARPVLEQAFAALPPEVEAKRVEAQNLLRNKDDAENMARGKALWMEFSQEGIFTGDVHLTDRGADLLAKTVADTIFLAKYL